MTTLLSGIALAALSALTYLAYKHPSAYERLGGPLVIIVLAIGIGGFIWYMGNMITYSKLIPFIEYEKHDQAKEAASNITTPIWFFIACISLMVYLGILDKLPKLLAEQKPEDPKDDKEEE